MQGFEYLFVRYKGTACSLETFARIDPGSIPAVVLSFWTFRILNIHLLPLKHGRADDLYYTSLKFVKMLAQRI